MASFPTYEWFKVTLAAEWVAHVEINRPSKLNAFFEPMWLELRRVFDHLSTDPSVRVILLTGAGERAFTAGLDIQAAQSSTMLSTAPMDVARKAVALRRHVEAFQACVTAVEKCEKPVACVLHGVAFGLGVDLSCCTDVRFASADTRLCVKEVDLGLAADIGTLTRLPKIVGSATWVKDVCLSARVFGAEEALRVGYISGIGRDKKETVDMAVNWAVEVASKGPVAVQSTKELLNYSREHTTEEGLRYTAVWNAGALQTEDVRRAFGAGKGGKPRFEKL